MNTKSLFQVYLGLLIVALGVGLLLSGIDVLDFADFIKGWWPAVIIGFGLVTLISNVRAWLFGLIVTAVGTILLAQQYHWVSFSLWRVAGPFFIIIVGLAILFRRGLGFGGKYDSDRDTVSALGIFSGQKVRVLSQSFVGGDITCMFGGAVVDLRDAKMKGDKAKISMLAAFGGAEIRVPEGWRVHVSGLPLFGGWSNKAEVPKSKDAPVLTVYATAICGGFEVKN